MRIEFTGRQTEVAKPLRRLGERRLDKLARMLPGITRAHVVLSTDRHRQVAEVNIRSPHLDLLAREAASDFGASLGAAFDKLERQARDQMGKLRGRKRRAESPRRAEGAVPAARRTARSDEGPRLRPARPRAAAPPALRAQRVAVPRLRPAAALLQWGTAAEGVLLFRDQDSGRLYVLFRGRDGRPQLLEPEA